MGVCCRHKTISHIEYLTSQYWPFSYSLLPNKLHNIIMSLDELKDKHAGSVETASEAFHELCATVEALEAEREERREVVQTRVQTLRSMNSRLREKNQKLKAQYHALLDKYNELAEEVHDASDSSSSSDSDDGDDNCSIM